MISNDPFSLFTFLSVGLIILSILVFNMLYLKKSSEKIGSTTNINNVIESSMSYLNKKISRLDEKSEKSIAIATELKQNYENQEESIYKLSESVKMLTKAQIVFTKNLNIITEKIQEIKNSRKSQFNSEKKVINKNIHLGYDSPTYSEVSIPRLTPTEMTVLRVLATSGPKSASEIREIIGKTREHSARLMKKLFSQGYIQRDTTIIPYSYKINESIKESIEFSPENK